MELMVNILIINSFYSFFHSVGEIIMYNIFYEINPLCTSIVGQDESGLFVKAYFPSANICFSNN